MICLNALYMIRCRALRLPCHTLSLLSFPGVPVHISPCPCCCTTFSGDDTGNVATAAATGHFQSALYSIFVRFYDFKGGLLYNTGDSCICYFNATHARRLDDNFCFAFSFLSSEPTVSELQIPYWAKPCRLNDPPHPWIRYSGGCVTYKIPS